VPSRLKEAFRRRYWLPRYSVPYTIWQDATMRNQMRGRHPPARPRAPIEICPSVGLATATRPQIEATPAAARRLRARIEEMWSHAALAGLASRDVKIARMRSVHRFAETPPATVVTPRFAELHPRDRPAWRQSDKQFRRRGDHNVLAGYAHDQRPRLRPSVFCVDAHSFRRAGTRGPRGGGSSGIGRGG
jgi:hypothetical protein